MAALGLIFLALPSAGEMIIIPTPEPPKETCFTVLCYHRFVSRPETVKKPLSEYRLPVEEFRWQMQFLKDKGITPISMDRLKAYWFEGKPLPDKAVLLTFDDGFRSIYEKAYPVVKEFGYPGVLFLYTDFIRSQGDSMRYDEIAEMGRNGFDLESHTKSHMNLALEGEKMKLPDFRKLLKEELDEPIHFIREKFGITPRILAYSYGVFNEEVLRQTRQSGYKLAFTVNPGPNDRTVPPLQLKRNLVLYPTSHEAFEKMFQDKVLHLEDFSPGDGEIILKNQPVITGEIKDNIVSKTIEIQLGNRKFACHFDPKTHLFRQKVTAPLKAGGHMLTIRANDDQGQQRVYTWYFRVKHRNPREEENDPPTAIHQ